jgi:hypothetical protein
MDGENLSSTLASTKIYESDEYSSKGCFAVGGCNGVVILSSDEFSLYCKGVLLMAPFVLLFIILIGVAVLAVSLAV